MAAGRWTVVRYRLHPGQGERNEALVRDVFAELDRARPAGLRYATFKGEDGLAFTHVAWAEADPSPLLGVEAFQAFLAGLRDRCAEPPVVTQVDQVGAFGLLA